MNKKKIGLILILIAIIAVVVIVLINSNEKKEVLNTVPDKPFVENNTIETKQENIIENKENNETIKTEQNKEIKKLKVTKLDDGTLYTTEDEKIVPDIVIGDKYFDTQLSDISLNFSSYEGKTIEIEGIDLIIKLIDSLEAL